MTSMTNANTANGARGPVKTVVVVGSGVVGLSIALQLKVQGEYKVVIIARELPSDMESRQFASPWAGANWASTTADQKQQKRDEATFKQWQEWAKILPKDMIAEVPFVEYTHADASNEQVHEWRSRFLPGYQSYAASRGETATEFIGLTLNAPAFLVHLQEELQSTHSTLFPVLSGVSSQGGRNNGEASRAAQHHDTERQGEVTFVRATLARLSDVCKHVPDVQLIINASGLGARTLDDVCDETVFPIRGQTVLVQASRKMRENPRCAMKGPKNGNFHVEESLPEDQEFSYVIPRAHSGAIICGGCAIPNDWTIKVDQSLSDRILQRCVRIVPELLEDDVDAASEDAWKSVKVIAHGLGLRPARRDGLRLELERITTKDDLVCNVLHAYGAGGGGYQSGYGIAVEAYHKIFDFFHHQNHPTNGTRGHDAQ